MGWGGEGGSGRNLLRKKAWSEYIVGNTYFAFKILIESVLCFLLQSGHNKMSNYIFIFIF